MKLTPRLFRFLLTMYPPYMGMGFRVDRVSDDWYEMDLSMRLRFYNKNAVGTHFGGSLYAMIDPHFVLMFLQALGDDYIVWDKSAHIEFVKPGRGRVTALLRITAQDVLKAKEQTQGGAKYLPVFDVEIKDEQGDVVARVKKELYIREKRKKA